MQVKLLHGYSHDTIQRNIATLRSSGITDQSAIYTALCAARKSFFSKYKHGALANSLTYPGAGRLSENYKSDGSPIRQFKSNPIRSTKLKQSKINQAAKLIQDFSGHKARVFGRVQFPPNPDVGVVVGLVLGVSYETKRDGVNEKYYHRFTLKHSRPLLVSSEDGKQLYLLGGEYDFTERGIVDRK